MRSTIGYGVALMFVHLFLAVPVHSNDANRPGTMDLQVRRKSRFVLHFLSPAELTRREISRQPQRGCTMDLQVRRKSRFVLHFLSPAKLTRSEISRQPPQRGFMPPWTDLEVHPAGYSCNQGVPSRQLKLGELKLIYTEDEIPIRYDGSLSTIRKDGEMYFFHSFGCRLETTAERRSRHSWHKGPPDDPLKCHVGSKTDKTFWDYNGYYQDQAEKGIWILGMYQCPNGDLLAITHAELNNAPKGTRQRRFQQRFALGLGYSNDRGLNWTYCGEIVRPADDRHNVGGGAYIIRGDYLYVYFNDIAPGDAGARPTRIQCAARAKLDTVIEAAAKHHVTLWHKYRDGQWDVRGLSGQPGEDLIPHVTGGEDLHADAAYCTAIGKYLLTVQTHRAGKLLLFSSPDGLDWSLETIVDQVGNGAIQPYSSFVDFDGPSADCHTVDDDFFIYFPRKGPDPDRDYLYRRRITIEAPTQ